MEGIKTLGSAVDLKPEAPGPNLGFLIVKFTRYLLSFFHHMKNINKMQYCYDYNLPFLLKNHRIATQRYAILIADRVNMFQLVDEFIQPLSFLAAVKV